MPNGISNFAWKSGMVTASRDCPFSWFHFSALFLRAMWFSSPPLVVQQFGSYSFHQQPFSLPVNHHWICYECEIWNYAVGPRCYWTHVFRRQVTSRGIPFVYSLWVQQVHKIKCNKTIICNIPVFCVHTTHSLQTALALSITCRRHEPPWVSNATFNKIMNAYKI